MQKKSATIIVIIILLLIGTLVGAQLLTTVPDNPIGTVGNSAGNLNNRGLFCEDGDMIYFSNPYDNDYLYSMKSNGSDKRLLLDIPVEYINSGGDYLYFYKKKSSDNAAFGFIGNSNGIYQFKKSGKKAADCLDRTASGIVSLIDSYVYYQHYDNNEGITLYRVKINSVQKEQISKSEINPACVVGGNIYYPDTDNAFYLSVFNSNTLTFGQLNSERVYNPVYENGCLYYMNIPDNYFLYRYNLSDRTNQKLTSDRVDVFNVYGNYIYYQKNDAQNPALIRISTDGSNPQIVAKGNYTNINITSQYTYFQAFGASAPLYQTPTGGEISVTIFNPN